MHFHETGLYTIIIINQIIERWHTLFSILSVGAHRFQSHILFRINNILTGNVVFGVTEQLLIIN